MLRIKTLIISRVIMLFSFSVFAFDASTTNNVVDETESSGKITEVQQERVIDYSDFSGSPQIAMANPDYMVTAGDVYALSYAAGGSAVSYTITVDSSYKLRIANLGVVDANGKSFIALKKQVEDIVQKNYPMSGVQFVLQSPSAFKILVTGEVAATSELPVWGLTRLLSVVNAFMTPYSSMRDVEVISQSGKSKVYDLFKAERDGDLAQNPYMRPGDTVKIGHVKRQVSIKGAVERPGTYELLDGENLKALINYYAHGLISYADTSRIVMTRRDNEAYPSGENIYLSQKDIDDDYQLYHSDNIVISTYIALRPVMFVEGAIGTDKSDTQPESSNRRALQFEYNTNYAYFVRQYSQLFSASSADLANAYIVRKGNVIPVDLTEMLYNQSYYSDLLVEPNDLLRIPFKQYFVSVAGSVYNPGRYPFIPDRDAYYYIGLAGGLVKDRNVFDAIVITDMNGKKMSLTDEITPECTITAKTNSFTYYFNQYAPVLTTILSILSSTLSLLVATRVWTPQ